MEEHPKSASFTTPPEMRRFVGLMSRWMNFLACRNHSPSIMSVVYLRTSGSGSAPNSLIASLRVPSVASSRKIRKVFLVHSAPMYLMMFRWSRLLRIFTSCCRACACCRCFLPRRRVTSFTAMRSPVLKLIPLNTEPKLPLPRSSPFFQTISYFSIPCIGGEGATPDLACEPRLPSSKALSLPLFEELCLSKLRCGTCPSDVSR
mmetsp:Transcript_2977/g.6907  ORF Transcript_2977/g.6907 Transcript_2977/m.6907 type:complete len:204 (+) Transcript_2977:2576-3187(+)